MNRRCMGPLISLGAVLGGSIVAADRVAATDGVLEINQVSALEGGVTAGDGPGFPVEIFTSGSYRLTSDLVVPAGVPAGIQVYGGGSRIDLNGFAISSTTQCTGTPPSCSPTGTGIGIDSSGAADVGIRNGRIAGFGVYGLFLAEGSRAEDLAVESNGTGGIVADEGCLIADNIVRRNGGVGVQAGTGSRIARNVIQRNGGQGIISPQTALAQDNALSLNVGATTAQARGRRYYMSSSTSGTGSEALSACAEGFHMASRWELLDPSGLTYDTTLGVVYPDAGSGPPTSTAQGSGGFAWIRTGSPTSGSTSNTPGFDNCRAWTSSASGDQGTAAALSRSALAQDPTWPWALVSLPCNQPLRVWCVED